MEHDKNNFPWNYINNVLSHEDPSHLEKFERKKWKNILSILTPRLSDITLYASRIEDNYIWKILKWNIAYEKCSMCQVQEEEWKLLQIFRTSASARKCEVTFTWEQFWHMTLYMENVLSVKYK